MIIEDIVINQIFVGILEESGLWELHWELNTIFPDNSKDKNLRIAVEVTSMLYDTDKIAFYSDNPEQEKKLKQSHNFLRNTSNWALPQNWTDAIWSITTKLGDTYYAEFKKKFWNELPKKGFLRQGKLYKFGPGIFQNIKHVLAFGDLVRTLGTLPNKVEGNLLEYTDRLSGTQCLVEPMSNSIVSITSSKNCTRQNLPLSSP